MWRFLNRAYTSGRPCPRPSIGGYVDDGEQDGNKQISRTCNYTHCTAEEESAETKCIRREPCGLIRILLGLNPNYRNILGRYTNQGERTEQEKEEQWWKTFSQNLNGFLNTTNLVQIFAAGTFLSYAWENKDSARKRLLHRILFALSKGENVLHITGKEARATEPSPLSLVDDISKTETKDTASKNESSAHIENNEDPESLEAAFSEFQDICRDYSATRESLLGLEAAEDGDMSRALYHLKRACSEGNVSACFNVGLFYETGSGVNKNLDEAIKSYREAAEHGHCQAKYNLGLIYLNSPSHDSDAIKESGRLFIEEAAKMGLAEAQTQMGILCMENKSAEDAFGYFKAAANQKDCEAQYFLALCYQQGLGVEADLEKSSRMFSLAAEAGHVEAVYNLAVFTELGLGGLKADSAMATELYQRAADAGHSQAQTRLEELASQKSPSQANEKRASQESISDISQSLSSSSSCGSLYLSHSSSSPSLTDRHVDITSLLFPMIASVGGRHTSLADLTTDRQSHGVGRNSRGFYISNEDMDILNTKPVSNSMTLERNDNSDLHIRELSYPMYGHIHKSYTSPNLSAMVACNI